jgi:hypothetical protein
MRRRTTVQWGRRLRRISGRNPAPARAPLRRRSLSSQRSVQGSGGKKGVRQEWVTQLPIMLTALAAVGALYFNTQQTSESLQATRDQLGLSEQGQITDRFSKAVAQLGTKESMEVRLGGIYAWNVSHATRYAITPRW